MTRTISGLAATLALLSGAPALAGTEPYIGEIVTFGGYFCPQGWLPADGRLQQIGQNTPLFSLLGTRFGGDGVTTFGLPDLRGRLVVGAGQGPGLSDYALGESGGAESVALTAQQIPAHAHGVAALGAPPSAQVRGTPRGGIAIVRSSAAGATENTASAGGGQPHENRQPYLATTRCIAVLGVYPPRP